MSELTRHTTSGAMDAETFEALRGSIAKWEGIVAGTESDRMGDNCPLCLKFKSCKGCPVALATQDSNCWGSPYWKWRGATRFQDSYVRRVTNDTERAAAQAELDFLKSLLPVDTRSDDERSQP